MTKHDKQRIKLAKKAEKLAAQAAKLYTEIRSMVEEAEDGYSDEVQWNKGQYHAGWIPMKKAILWEVAFGLKSDLEFIVRQNKENVS